MRIKWYSKVKELTSKPVFKRISLVAGVSTLVTALVITACVGDSAKKDKDDISTIPDTTLATELSEEVDIISNTRGVHLESLKTDLSEVQFCLVDFSATYDDRGKLIELVDNQDLVDYARKNGVEVGYIYNVTTEDRANMYLGINELKKHLEQNDINYPIVYNIDVLHSKSSKEYNYIILKSFIEKMNENNCYVMIGGLYENINDMKAMFEKYDSNIKYNSIDKLVFDDVELMDDLCMQMVNGKIRSKFNYSKFIDLNNINYKTNFVNDYTYRVLPNDDIKEIAKKFDFNVYNILKMNGKYTELYNDQNKLFSGQLLTIPTYITKQKNVISIRKYDFEEKEPVIDILQFNGSYIKDKQVEIDLEDKNFALIDFAANFNEKGKLQYISGNYAFSKCIKSGIPYGVVFKPYDNRLSDIYCSINMLKRYMLKYNVEYPIYYDIDILYEKYGKDSYNYIMSKSFIEKMEYNGCFVGFIGSQSNMEKLRKEYSDKNDSKFFENVSCAIRVAKDEEITYKGNYSLLAYDDGSVKSLIDYKSIITEKGLNLSSNFKEDFTYEVKEGDTLDSLAKKFEFKEWNIKMYNPQYNIAKEGIKPGQILAFPNILDETKINNITTPEISIDSNGKYYVGVDVSDDRGRIDWDELSKHIDYAILKFGNGWFFEGFGGYGQENILDDQFERNYSECKRLGIPVGVYVFSNFYVEQDENGQYINENYKDEARREAEFAANYLRKNGYELDLPFYMDYEERTSNSCYELATANQITEIINIQKEVIESYGYYFGYYCNANFLRNKIQSSVVDYESWIASYPGEWSDEAQSWIQTPFDYSNVDNITTTHSLEGNCNMNQRNSIIYVGNQYIGFKPNSEGIIHLDLDVADEDLFKNSKEFYKKQRN